MKARTKSGATVFPGCRLGFTLLEMMVGMWALAIVFLLGTATLLGALKVDRMSAAISTRLAVRSAVADEFRADVSQAASSPESLDKLEASPTCLILRVADGKDV